MNYFIFTYQKGCQLLGSDYTTIVRGCKTHKKLDNARKRHINKLESLKQIHTTLNQPYELVIKQF